MASNPPRVFVVQGTSRFNLSQASKHGELIELLPENTHITLSPQPVLRALRHRLKDFNDSDHLLLIGDPVAIGLAIFAAAEANVGRVRVLKWDHKLGDYYLINIDCYDRMADLTEKL